VTDAEEFHGWKRIIVEAKWPSNCIIRLAGAFMAIGQECRFEVMQCSNGAGLDGF
jgi:hypothetical protein